MDKFFENKIFEILDQTKNIFGINELIEEAHGMYIKEINLSLHRYIDIGTNELGKLVAQNIIQEFNSEFDIDKYATMINKTKYLPIPHILDSDWRFTYESTLHFAKLIKNLSRKRYNNIVLVGTPSLFLSFKVNKNLPEKYSMVLIEKNFVRSPNVSTNNMIFSDVSQFTLSNYADIVVCDPPWYMDAIVMFIKSAQRMLRLNGVLIIVVPPIGVRETIKEEYNKISELANKWGLETKSLIEEQIHYISPPFEINALGIMGITNFPLDWRRGNILILKKTSNIDVSVIESNLIITKEIWKEASVKNVRIKVKCEVLQQEEFVKRITASDIYPTVSMRNDLQKVVNVWTTGNRVYTCRNTFLFYEVLCQVSKIGLKSRYLDEIEGDENEKRSYYQLICDIVEMETKEYAYLWN